MKAKKSMLFPNTPIVPPLLDTLLAECARRGIVTDETDPDMLQAILDRLDRVERRRQDQEV